MVSATHSVAFYGLSTCIHCKHAKEFLEQHHVSFDLHYVDQAEGEERATLLAAVRKHNPSVSFPTIVIDDSTCLVGYKPEAMARALDI